MTIEDDAVWLSKAVLKLEANGFIQTFEEDEELHCENLRGAAVYYARKIQTQATRNNAGQAAALTHPNNEERQS